jgi:hypothetical protein
MYWSYFWEFVKRNLLTIVIMAVVAVTFPWTLIFIIPIAVVILRLQMAVWKVRRTYEGGAQQQRGADRAERNQKSGKVTVVQTEQTEQRVNDNVGEYVDFKEIKEEETK